AARSTAVAHADRGAHRAHRRRRIPAARPQLRSLPRLDLLAHEAPMKTLPFVSLVSLVSLLGLAACGDNQRNAPDAGPPIEAGGPQSRAVVVVGDFNPGDFGALSTLDPATRTVHKTVGPTGAVGSDPVLRHIGRELLIVNRG